MVARVPSTGPNFLGMASENVEGFAGNGIPKSDCPVIRSGGKKFTRGVPSTGIHFVGMANELVKNMTF